MSYLRRVGDRSVSMLAVLFAGFLTFSGCHKSAVSSLVEGSSAQVTASPTFTEQDMADIYFLSDPKAVDAPLAPWPRLTPVSGISITSEDLTAQVLKFLHEDSVCNFIQAAAVQNNVKVSFVGVSAARFVYRALLAQQRLSGYQQITQQAVRGDFDNIFPLYNSEMELYVEGADHDAQAFETAIQDLGRLVIVSVNVGAPGSAPPQGLDSVSRTSLPLIGDWTVPADLAADLQSGVLNGDLSNAAEYRISTLKALNALALFNLQPSAKLAAQLKANLWDVSAYNYLQSVETVIIPRLYTFLGRYVLSRWGNVTLNYEITKLYSQMYAEAADLEAFSAQLKGLNYWFALVTPDASFDLDFTKHARFFHALPTPSDPLAPYQQSDRYKDASLSDVAQGKVLLFNHANKDWDAYRRISLNPYGKVNGALSDGGFFNGTTSSYGPAIYTVPGWDKMYYPDAYPTLIVQSPSLSLAPGSVQQPDKDLDKIFASYVLLSSSAETQVFEPPYAVDGVALFQYLVNPPTRKVITGLSHERRMLIDLAFNPQFQSQRLELEQWFAQQTSANIEVSDHFREARFRLGQLTDSQKASYAAWIQLNPYAPPKFEVEFEGDDYLYKALTPEQLQIMPSDTPIPSNGGNGGDGGDAGNAGKAPDAGGDSPRTGPTVATPSITTEGPSAQQTPAVEGASGSDAGRPIK